MGQTIGAIIIVAIAVAAVIWWFISIFTKKKGDGCNCSSGNCPSSIKREKPKNEKTH